MPFVSPNLFTVAACCLLIGEWCFPPQGMPQSDAFGDLLGGLGMGTVAPAQAATNNVTASADDPSILAQPGVYIKA